MRIQLLKLWQWKTSRVAMQSRVHAVHRQTDRLRGQQKKEDKMRTRRDQGKTLTAQTVLNPGGAPE